MKTDRGSKRTYLASQLATLVLAGFWICSSVSVYAQVPHIDILQPTSTEPGGPDFTLTIIGTGLLDGTTVNFDGVVYSPNCNPTGTQCTATVPATSIAAVHTASVTMVGSGGASNVVFFPVTYPTPRVLTVPALPNSGVAVPPIATQRTDLSVSGQFAVGDFNRDGKLDLVGSAGRTLIVLVGDGMGGFATTSTDFSDFVSVMAMGDFNGDGETDLVSGAGTSLITLLGDGLGGFFVGPTSTRVAGATAIGDFNSDGHLDLVVGNINIGDDTVTILLGDGMGGFLTAPSSIATGNEPSSLAVGDFNRDGKLDVVVAGDPIMVLLGDGLGEFTATPATPLSFFNRGPVAVGDFNRDGKLDVALARRFTDSVTILLGDGAGGFQPNPRSFPTGRLPTDLEVGDFNGDGNLDLATPIIGNPFNTGCLSFDGVSPAGPGLLYVLLGDGMGGFFDITNVGITGNCPFAVALGDFNGDGRSDFVVANPGFFNSSSFSSEYLQRLYPIATRSLDGLRFDDQVVGTTSEPRAVTLTNRGTAPLEVTDVTIEGPFSFSAPHDCLLSSPLAPGASCTEYVTWTPVRITRIFTPFLGGTMIFTNNSGDIPGNQQGVTLSGNGTAPVFLSADVGDGIDANLIFGDQPLNTTSPARVATVTNTHLFPVSVNGISILGDFAFAAGTTCPLSGGMLEPNASCTLAVTFTPTTAGFLTGIVKLSLNGIADLQFVLLDGTGVEDATAPTITLTTPPEGAVYALNQVVNAAYTCQDEAGGSGLASCVGNVATGAPINTATVGGKTFTVTATDNAGNSGSLSHTYSVIYSFNGFLQPIDNLPVLNRMKAGAAAPVKFSLGGNQGLSIFAAGYPASQQIPCDSTALANAVEETMTAGSSSLSYNATADQYTYVWKTEQPWSGTCRQFVMKLNDGTFHWANFKFD